MAPLAILGLSVQELVIILLIVVVLFGARRIPDIMRGLGQGVNSFKKGIRGEYRVKVHYVARDANRASARTKVYATVYENWGRSNERVRTKTVTLRSSGGEHEIALVERP